MLDPIRLRLTLETTLPANEILAIGMFISFIALVFTGFPVAWLLGGLSVVFSALAVVLEAQTSISQQVWTGVIPH